MGHHVPVMKAEILQMIQDGPKKVKYFLDGTFGRGGHTREVFGALDQVKVFGLDRDQDAIDFGRSHFKEELSQGRIHFLHGSLRKIDECYSTIEGLMGDKLFDAILLDLGVSSPQLDEPHRGFSFYHDGPLDMRMDSTQELSAYDIVNHWEADDLREVFIEFGEVRRPGRVVSQILAVRKAKPIETTGELSRLIEKVEGWRRRGHHPATNYFLGLRLKVNEELDQIKEALPKLLPLLSPGGRLLVITFHSLEDRIVKYIFRSFKEEKKGILVNKKVIQPQWTEKKANPRARSAKLRVFQKSEDGDKSSLEK